MSVSILACRQGLYLSAWRRAQGGWVDLMTKAGLVLVPRGRVFGALWGSCLTVERHCGARALAQTGPARTPGTGCGRHESPCISCRALGSLRFARFCTQVWHS